MLRPDRSHRHRPRWLVAGLVASLGTGLVIAPEAAAATTPSVNLKVLVIDRSAAGVADTTTEAVAAELTREGVPYDVMTVAQANALTTAQLEDATNHRALYQGVVMADPFELTAAALNVIKDVETRYGLRQVNTDAFPGASEGLSAASYAGTLDGAAVTATAAAKADAFGYLAGSLKVDDADPSVSEVFGYIAKPLATQAAGDTLTSLLDISYSAPGSTTATTGSLASVFTSGGRDQLTLTAAGSDVQQWLPVLTPGIVDWVTRGVNLGYHRNYFGIHIDDVFLPDSRWSDTGKCTPGDGCVDPTVTTTDIRMTPADVTRLVTWTKAHGFAVDLAFNGSGSIQAANGGKDALLTAFQQAGVGSLFRWIDHTYTHTFLGCIQIAPTVANATWRCATPADTTGFEDPTLATDATKDTTNNITWLSQARISADIQQNIAWAATAKLPNFDPAVLVTGEHSGLLTTPQQPVDNPNLAPALSAAGIVVTASDASRETGQRMVGSTQTLPRHPMNIFYNAGTFQDEVSEYNWMYTVPNTNATTGANTGGICVNSTVTTCMATPLAATDDSTAKASFTSYVLPIEIRNALRYVLSGDPRPFYAHQSNLAEDGIVYPVLEGILSGYAGLYDTTRSPLVNTDMKGQAQALSSKTAWATAMAGVTGYVDATGVHVNGPAGTQVPVTVPSSSTGTTGLTPYDSGLSGWISATGSDTVVATLNPAGAGYKVAPPAAPTSVSAVPGVSSATVTWTPGDQGAGPVTSWTITATTTDATAAVAPATVLPTKVTAGATAGTLSYPLTGLKPGASYTFDVYATNIIGPGAHSAPSSAVTILGLPAVPTIAGVTPGDGSALVTWTPGTPAAGVPALTGFVVTASDGTTSVTKSATPTATSLTVTGLTNGKAYTFTVTAVNPLGRSTSAPSAPVTVAAPAPTPPPAPPAGGGSGPRGPVSPGAPTLGTVTAGNGRIDLAWTAPASDGGSAITDYVVTVRRNGDGTVAATVKASGSSAAVLGLTNGTGYTVEVAAENVAGIGPASARSAVVTPSTVPSKVTGVTVKRGAASLAVRWGASANGGSAITGYRVNVYVGKAAKVVTTVSVQGLATIVPGLKNGTGYTVDVQALNASGAGPLSARSAVVTPATTPGRAVITGTKAGAKGGRSTAIVTWKAPASNGGSAITSYRITAVTYSAQGTVLRRIVFVIRSGRVRAAELRLAAGTYRFTVQAVNAVGAGAASGPSRPTAAR